MSESNNPGAIIQGAIILVGQYSSGAIVLGANCEGAMIRGTTVQAAIVGGGNFPQGQLSGHHYFHMKAKISVDFQICISVPLTKVFLAKSYIMIALRYCCMYFLLQTVCLCSGFHKQPSQYSHDTLLNSLNNQAYQNENTALIWDFSLLENKNLNFSFQRLLSNALLKN